MLQHSTNIKLYKVSITPTVLLYSYTNYKDVYNQINKILYNLQDYITNYKQLNIQSFNIRYISVNIKNRIYTVLRSSIAFKKRGKESFNNRRRYLRFTITVSYTTLHTINVDFDRFFIKHNQNTRLFGGTVVGWNISFFKNIQLFDKLNINYGTTTTKDSHIHLEYNTPLR